MKYLALYSLLFLSLLSTDVSAQPFGIQLEVDEFDGDTLLVTDWQTLNDPTWKKGRIAYVRCVKSKDVTVLQLKTTTGGEFVSVDADDKFLIKLENDEVLTLANEDYELVEKGAGSVGLRGSNSLGVSLVFQISNDQIKQLSESGIFKVRLTTSKGNLEIEPEKKKWTKELQDYFKLFLQMAEMY